MFYILGCLDDCTNKSQTRLDVLYQHQQLFQQVYFRFCRFALSCLRKTVVYDAAFVQQ